MNKLLIIYFIIIYLSLPGYFVKANYSFWKALIPIYNIYILFEILQFNKSILLIILGFIFIPYTRIFTLTTLYVFMPSLIAKAYNKNFIIGILGIIFPYIFYPFISYFPSTYVYAFEEDVWHFLRIIKF